jgi:hypothetical protein
MLRPPRRTHHAEAGVEERLGEPEAEVAGFGRRGDVNGATLRPGPWRGVRLFPWVRRWPPALYPSWRVVLAAQAAERPGEALWAAPPGRYLFRFLRPARGGDLLERAPLHYGVGVSPTISAPGVASGCPLTTVGTGCRVGHHYCPPVSTTWWRGLEREQKKRADLEATLRRRFLAAGGKPSEWEDAGAAIVAKHIKQQASTGRDPAREAQAALYRRF